MSFLVVGLAREALTISTSHTTLKTKRSPPITSPSPSSEQDTQVESMATKVKDVLPQVPLKVIKEDLSKFLRRHLSVLSEDGLFPFDDVAMTSQQRSSNSITRFIYITYRFS